MRASFGSVYIFDSITINKNPQEALDGLLSHLARKNFRNDWVRHEFAGRLAPFTELENMAPKTFINFMSEHIKTTWPKLPPKGKSRYSREMAGDIYFSARTFKLPLTFLAALMHQLADVHRGTINSAPTSFKPQTLEIFSHAARLIPLIGRTSVSWQDGAPPLCDLDDVLQVYMNDGLLTTPDDVFKKKMLLIESYKRLGAAPIRPIKNPAV
ncbi:MAG: hypothetical protein ACRCTY_08875 [Candidatus Adiutrix sp.]